MRVLVAERVHPVLLDSLARLGIEADYRPGAPREWLLENVASYEVMVVRGRVRVDSELLARGARGRLRAVIRAGVGLDSIDLDAARRLGVEVYNTPSAPTESVAELAIGLMIAVARRVVELNLRARQGEWVKGEGVELNGKTLLVVGLGRIGGRVAEIARAGFNMRVLGYDLPWVLEKKQGLVEPVTSLIDGISSADFISIHVPLTPETKGLIGRRELSYAKRGAILVNTARGAVVDPEALLWAVQEGILAGAGLDVLIDEPPRSGAELELLRHPRVVVTPHIGSQTREAQERTAREVVSIIARLAGLKG